MEKKIFSNKAQKGMFGLLLLVVLSVLTFGITIAFFTDSDFATGHVNMSGKVLIEAVGDAVGDVSIEDKEISDGSGGTIYQSNLRIEPTDRLIPNMPLSIIANCKVDITTTEPLLRASFSMEFYREVEEGGVLVDKIITPETDTFNISSDVMNQFDAMIVENDYWYKFTDGNYYFIGKNPVNATDPKYTQLEEIDTFDDTFKTLEDVYISNTYVVVPFIKDSITFPSFVTTDYSGLKAKFIITFEAIQNFIPDDKGFEYFYDDGGVKKNNTIEFSKYIFDDERDEGITANTLNLCVDDVLTSYEITTGKTITNTLSDAGINITDNNSLGWYKDRNLTQPVDNSTIVTKGMTLYTYMATLDKLTISGTSVSIKQSATGRVVIPKRSSNNLIVTINANGTPSNGSDAGSLFIPMGVKTISQNSFDNFNDLKVVIFMGDSELTTIGTQAFYNCTSLQSLLIPNTVSSISSDLFGFCDKLTSIKVKDGCSTYHTEGHCLIYTSSKTLVAGCNNSNIPSDGSVTSIGDNAFRNLTKLRNLTIPANIVSIGHYAFYNCDTLDGVYIPDGTTTIGNYSFAECDTLNIVELSKSVNSLNYTSFCGNITLDNFVINPNNTTYHSDGDCIIHTSSKVLISGCRGSIIPTDGSVTEIGTGAFFECRTITTIVVPFKITKINTKAFQNCDSLSSIYIYNTTTTISASSLTDGTFVSEVNRSLTIYTNAESKLSGWGTNWDNVTSSAKATIEYSRSYAHYLQCIKDLY